MKMSETMKTTLETLDTYESIIGAGVTTGEIEAAGGSPSSLRTAIKNGWANRYSTERYNSENRAPAYYLTAEGETALTNALNAQ